MTNKTPILILLLLLFLLMPTKFASVPAMADVDPIAAEGLVAVVANSLDFAVQPETPVSKCECNGTGFVMSGDGIMKIKCPCITCTCPKNAPASTKCACGCGKEGCTCGKTAAAGCDVPKDVYYTICFGATWCQPCQTFEHNDLTKLEKDGWKIARKEWVSGANVVHVDIDENPALFNKYTENRMVPFYVVVHNNVKVDSHTGYMNWLDFANFHNATITKDRLSK